MKDYLPVLRGIPKTFRGRRSVYEGYQRGWGLEYGDLRRKVSEDTDYLDALKYAEGRTILGSDRLKNLFLLVKFYLPRLPFGHIIEYGSYRGGSAFFIAAIAAKYLPRTQVYALDTFTGMPKTEKTVDAHNAGDFSATDLDEILKAKADYGLTGVHFVKGLFSDTASAVLAKAEKIILAHIDCDIYEAVKYCYTASKPYMVPRGYYVFDDSPSSSCIGANEAVETVAIQQDGLLSEQSYRHYVFRSPGVE